MELISVWKNSLEKLAYIYSLADPKNNREGRQMIFTSSLAHTLSCQCPNCLFYWLEWTEEDAKSEREIDLRCQLERVLGVFGPFTPEEYLQAQAFLHERGIK